jgi:Tfp pilus assembly PilM family ATPase
MTFLKTIKRYIRAPRIMSMAHVGIDITPTSIRFLELIKTYNGLKLGRFGTQDIPVAETQYENILDNPEVVTALKKIQRANKK